MCNDAQAVFLDDNDLFLDDQAIFRKEKAISIEHQGICRNEQVVSLEQPIHFPDGANPALITCVQRIVKGMTHSAHSVLGFASRPL